MRVCARLALLTYSLPGKNARQRFTRRWKRGRPRRANRILGKRIQKEPAIEAHAAPLDHTALLANWLGRVVQMYVDDLRALPAGAFTTSIGGKCRTPQDFTADVARLSAHAAALARSETPPPGGAPQLRDVEAGVKAVTDTAGELVQAMLANPGSLADTVTSPWNEEMPLFRLAYVAANQLLYHDALLSQIRLFHDDGEPG